MHATSVFMCMCMYKPRGETRFKVECDSQPYSQIKTCQPCSPAPLFLHLFSLSIRFLHPYCSLKQVPALISQKNNWEVYHLQYPGPRPPPPTVHPGHFSNVSTHRYVRQQSVTMSITDLFSLHLLSVFLYLSVDPSKSFI